MRAHHKLYAGACKPNCMVADTLDSHQEALDADLEQLKELLTLTLSSSKTVRESLPPPRGTRTLRPLQGSTGPSPHAGSSSSSGRLLAWSEPVLSPPWAACELML